MVKRFVQWINYLLVFLCGCGPGVTSSPSKFCDPDALDSCGAGFYCEPLLDLGGQGNKGMCQPGVWHDILDSQADPSNTPDAEISCEVTGDEECDGIDNDCDGLTDEDLYSDDISVCKQAGICERGRAQLRTVCVNGQWVCDYSLLPDYEGEEEVSCDGMDNDCDGETDEERTSGACDHGGYRIYYYDRDGDGYGDPLRYKCLCAPFGNYSTTKPYDCDDKDPSVHPEALEMCNGKDDNCDNLTDELWPAKGEPCDGADSDLCEEGRLICNSQGTELECNDKSGDTKEVCDNKQDDDCDGMTDENEEDALGCRIYYYDNDGDQYGTSLFRCLCSPDPLERYMAAASGDCDDSDPEINPGTSEKCNEKDDDCDYLIDEERTDMDCGSDGYEFWFLDADNDTYGVTEQRRCLCSAEGLYRAWRGGDCDDRDPNVNPGHLEVCGNHKDDDCDSATDENQENAMQCTNYYYDNDRDGYGTLIFKCYCTPSPPYTALCSGDCDDFNPLVHPGGNCGQAQAVCGADGDCNGSALDPGEVCDDRNDVRWDGCTDCMYLDIQVNTWTTDSQTDPAIASQSGGGFVVVWRSQGQDGSMSGVYGQRFDAKGNRLGSEFRVNTWTTDHQWDPSIAPASDGGFIVVWSSMGQDGSNDAVIAQRFDANGNKIGTEFQVNTWTTGWQLRPSVSLLSNNGFVVVWESINQDGSGSGVFGQRLDASGNRLGAEFKVNTWTSNDQSRPQVVSLPNDIFVVVWQSGCESGCTAQDGSSWGVFYQVFDSSGNRIGFESRVNSWTTGGQSSPSLTALSDGGFVIVWESDGQDGSNQGIYGQRFDSTYRKVGSEFRVNTWTTDSQVAPSVASLSTGGFIVVWASNNQDGSQYGVYGQKFDATGKKIGSEFLVNTWTDNRQQSPAVALLSDRRFVVTWESVFQDGSSSGIYFRIFGE